MPSKKIAALLEPIEEAVKKVAKKAAAKKAAPTPVELAAAKTVEKGQKWRAAQYARHHGQATAEDIARAADLAKMAKKNAAKLANWQAERERKHAGVG